MNGTGAPARTMRFRDHQASARSATALLLLLFVVVLLGMLAAVNGALALAYRLTFPMAQGWPRLFFETNTALVLLFVLGGCWIESLRLREGGAHVARMAGGQLVAQPRDRRERRLLNVVDELALASGMRRAPPVYLLPREDGINAFAAGWQVDDAVVAVTRGALERLTRDELQGVLAHEFSHILHEDMQLNMRLIGLVWGLQMLFNFGRLMSEAEEGGRHPATALFGFALRAVGSIGWVAGRLLKAAVSRQREYLADASAVQFTRHPEGIGGALRKIADQARGGRDALRAPQAESLSHLLFSSRLDWGGFFATHPPLHRRLSRIYGHDVEPLPAERVADDAADDSGPRLGLVPLRPPAADFVRAVSSDDAPSLPPWTPPAPEDPAVLAREREAEALRRLRGWHGAGVRRAGVLALLMRPGDARQLQVWRDEVGEFSHAKEVLADAQALSAAARLPALMLLLERCAAAPYEERRALLGSAHRLLSADGRCPPRERLHWLVLARQLREAAPGDSRPTAAMAGIEPLLEPIARLTAFLAPLVEARAGAADPLQGTAEAQAPAWYGLALQALQPQAAPPAWQPPDEAAPGPALQALEGLAPLQRPRLVKAWLEAACRQRGGVLPEREAADALWLACRLLDTPLPPALAGCFIELSEPASSP